MTNKHTEKENETPLYIAISLTILILGHLVIFGFLVDNSFYTKVIPDINSTQFIGDVNSTEAVFTLNNKGLLGDFFSGHFTFLAFIWMTYAVIVQRKEYRLQRNEFEGQTKEFKLQRQQFEEQNLHARYNRLHNLLSETYYNIEYKQGENNYKGLSSLFQEIRIKPNDNVALKNMDIIFKFMTTYHFIEKELDSLLDKYADSQQLGTIRNIKKEFILQWRDVYASCLRSYTLVSLVYLKNNGILEFYLNIDFIEPMLNDKYELFKVSRKGESSVVSNIRKYVESINYTKDISKYFNMAHLDFDIVI